MLSISIRNLCLSLFLFAAIAVCQESSYLGRQEVNPNTQSRYNQEMQDLLSSRESWQSFKTNYGTDLVVVWDELTLTPRIISGGSVSHVGGSLPQINSEFGFDIINQFEPLLGLSVSSFKLNKVTIREGRSLLRYTQIHEGHHVYGSEVQILITPSGEIT